MLNMLFMLILAASFFVIGFAILVIGNYIWYATSNWFGLSSSAINPTIMPLFGIFLMVLGVIIFIVKHTGNAENSGGR